MHQASSIPKGIWAICSDLEGFAEGQAWLTTAAPAAAVTLRRPRCEPRESLQVLRAMVAQKSFVAVHGMADYAQATEAHAVIAGFRSLPLAVYKKRFPSLLLGKSTHSEEEVQTAVRDGANFLIFGPIWDTPEKQGFLKARGLERLESLCANTKVPVIAIGGIQSAERVAACKAAGAYGVAVLRAAKNLVTMTELSRAWDR
ncbi:MAG: thiamine phosphate synthase [Planctomycetota bacterium]|nr:thiamine phosphate synthase [Planctomycetota bacterium]MDA1114170.1 thiamine phosphate synthase [Planctomycetota bacterium]